MIVELLVCKKTQAKLKLVLVNALNCMNYDHNKLLGLFKFQSVYRKIITCRLITINNAVRKHRT